MLQHTPRMRVLDRCWDTCQHRHQVGGKHKALLHKLRLLWHWLQLLQHPAHLAWGPTLLTRVCPPVPTLVPLALSLSHTSSLQASCHSPCLLPLGPEYK